jgi:hypothetical protein
MIGLARRAATDSTCHRIAALGVQQCSAGFRRRILSCSDRTLHLRGQVDTALSYRDRKHAGLNGRYEFGRAAIQHDARPRHALPANLQPFRSIRPGQDPNRDLASLDTPAAVPVPLKACREHGALALIKVAPMEVQREDLRKNIGAARQLLELGLDPELATGTVAMATVHDKPTPADVDHLNRYALSARPNISLQSLIFVRVYVRK